MTDNVPYVPHCRKCDEQYPTERWALGYKMCIPCAEQEIGPVRTIVPMAKSNYILVTDLTLLKGLNKYAAQ